LCGITTLITKKLNINDLKEFEEVFKRQELRGGDSSGIYLGSLKSCMLFYNLSRSTKPSMDLLKKHLIDHNMEGEPLILMGHTRATATGTHKDFHPAISIDKKGVMIHNGVIYDSEGYYYHENDTYHLVNLLRFEGDSKKKKKSLKDRITTGGSTIFNLDVEKQYLEFSVMGHTPLKGRDLKDGMIFCSTPPNKLEQKYITIRDGFYKINLKNELFKNHNKKRPMIVNQGVKYIDNVWDYGYYNIVNGRDRQKGGIYTNTDNIKEECPLLWGRPCKGCLNCQRDNY